MIGLFIMLRTLNQVLFKQVAIGPAGSNYITLFVTPLFYAAAASFFAQAAVWILVLKRFDLSVAYPYTGITLITIMLSGAIFYSETITFGNILGALIIICGIWVIANDKSQHAPIA